MAKKKQTYKPLSFRHSSHILTMSCLLCGTLFGTQMKTPDATYNGVFLFSEGETSAILENYDSVSLSIRPTANGSLGLTEQIVISKSWKPSTQTLNPKLDIPEIDNSEPLVANFPYPLKTNLQQSEAVFSVLRLKNSKVQTVCLSEESISYKTQSKIIEFRCPSSQKVYAEFRSEKSHNLNSYAPPTKIANLKKEWINRAAFGYLTLASSKQPESGSQVDSTKQLEIFANPNLDGYISLILAIRNVLSEQNILELKTQISKEEFTDLLHKNGELTTKAIFKPFHESNELKNAPQKNVDATIKIEISEALPLSSLCTEQQNEAAVQISINTVDKDQILDSYTFEISNNQAYNCSRPNSIRIGTYNIENLWDDSPDNSTPYNDYSDEGGNWYSEKMFLKKIKQVAKGIALGGSPDILAVQELESAANKSRSLLLLKKKLAKLGYGYFALGHQDEDFPVSVTTGFISKIPVYQNESLRFELFDSNKDQDIFTIDKRRPSSSARNPQKTTYKIGQKYLVLYNNHWKSLRGGPKFARIAHSKIATLIQEDILETKSSNPHANVIVTGDLNSGHKYRYECSESKGKPENCHVTTPIKDILKVHGDKKGILEGIRKDLYNLWAEYKSAHQCSYFHHTEPQCFDNLYIDADLLTNDSLSYKDGSYRTLGISGGVSQIEFLGSSGKPFRWQRLNHGPRQDRFVEHLGIGYSDHLPVIAELNFKNNGISEENGKYPIDPVYPSSASHFRSCDKMDYVKIERADLNRLEDFIGKCIVLNNFGKAAVKFHKGGRAIRIGSKWLYLWFAGNQKDPLSGILADEMRYSDGNVVLTSVSGKVGWDYGSVGLHWFKSAEMKVDRIVPKKPKKSFYNAASE